MGHKTSLRLGAAVIGGMVMALLGPLNPAAAADPDWAQTTNLSGTGNSVSDPKIAQSTDGSKLAAIWTRNDGSQRIAQVRTSSDSGDTWTAATDLSLTGGSATVPQIASSSDGTVLTAAWYREVGAGASFIIQTRTSTDSGTTWGPITDLTPSNSRAFGPQIAMSADGTNLNITWNQWDMDAQDFIVTTRSSSDTGATWSAATYLSATGGNSGDQRTLMSSDGTKITAVWQRSDDGSGATQVQTVTSTDSGDTWGSVATLSDEFATAQSPQIAGSTDGSNLTVLWGNLYGDYQMKARTSTDGGASWGDMRDVSSSYFTMEPSFSFQPSLAASDDGTRLSAAWIAPPMFDPESVAKNTVATSSSTTTGDSWSPTSELTGNDIAASQPEVAVSGDGTRVTVAWTRHYGPTAIETRSSTNGGTDWGSTATLSDFSANAEKPRLVYSNDGYHLAAIWMLPEVVQFSSAVVKSDQTITFGALSNKTLSQSPVTVSATASSGLPVTFTSRTTGVCTVSGTTVTLVTNGTCTIRASQSGDATYAAAPDVDRSFTVSKDSQTITFGALSNKTLSQSPVTVSATASSGLPVTFTSRTTGICTVSGTTVTLVTNGTCTIRAAQSGNALYAAAANVDRSFTVSKDSQTITFDGLANASLGAGSRPVSATASSGLAVTFASQTTGVCTSSGTTVTLVATGTCTIRATQAGNGVYAAAAPVEQSFDVTTNPSQALSMSLTGKTATWPAVVGATQYFVMYREVGSAKNWGVYATASGAAVAQVELDNRRSKVCSTQNVALGYTNCALPYGFVTGKTYEFNVYSKDASGKTSLMPLQSLLTYTP